MVKRISIFVLLLFCLSFAKAQSQLTHTLANYTESQKRLVAKNIGRFLYVANQGQWDLDSSILFACGLYGISRLHPYDEMINKGTISYETDLLVGDRIHETIDAMTKLDDERKIQVLLELAIYYLHQAGNTPDHLASARTYIENARVIAQHTKSTDWNHECDALMGEYYFQKGEHSQALNYFSSIVKNLSSKGNIKRLGIAHHQLALHLAFNDVSRIRHLEKAFAIFEELELKEHAIEVLSDIVTYYFMTDFNYAEIKLQEVLALEKKSGYKHIMDTYYVISFLRGLRSDYMGSLNYADSCITTMTNTGDSTIFSMVCYRMGAMYHMLGEQERSYHWAMKGLERRGLEPKLFWYENLKLLAIALSYQGEVRKGVALLENISEEYPPEGIADSLGVIEGLAVGYRDLGESEKAERYFNLLANLLGRIPPEYIQPITIFSLHEVARYYLLKKQYALSRKYIDKALLYSQGRGDPNRLLNIYSLLYILDSIDGNYRGAFINHMKFKLYWDSVQNISQRYKSQELNVRYASEKKDKDIQILTQDAVIKESALLQEKQTRNIILGGAALLLAIAALLYNQYRIKNKNARIVEQKNAKLVQLVDEKEWLLKEVHHRVKNNLQTIVSLLELQTEFLSPDALSAIQASQNRIYATSLLHQKLYRSDNLSAVDMSSYIPELIHYLKEAYNVSSNVYFKINIAPVEMDASQAVPVGLIVSEAITNSIKHAFINKKTGAEILVSLIMKNADTLELMIADNGAGFQAGSDEKEQRGLGLKLIKGLTEDFDGHTSFKSEAGTAIKVEFKPQLPLTIITKQRVIKSTSS